MHYICRDVGTVQYRCPLPRISPLPTQTLTLSSWSLKSPWVSRFYRPPSYLSMTIIGFLESVVDWNVAQYLFNQLPLLRIIFLLLFEMVTSYSSFVLVGLLHSCYTFSYLMKESSAHVDSLSYFTHPSLASGVSRARHLQTVSLS